MKEQDVSELCRQVNQVVKQAVEYAQSPQFQDTIQQGVQKTVNGVKKTVGNFTAGMRQQPPYQPPNFYPGGNYRQRVKPHVRPTVRPPIYPNYNTPPVYPQTGRPQVVAKSAKTGPSKGTGLFVLGGICTFVFFVILATMLGDFLISPISMLEDLSGNVIALVLFAGGAGVSFVAGAKSRGRFQRGSRYWGILQGRTICPVAELASGTNRSKEFVIKDMQKMADKHLLPPSYLDSKKENLIFGYDAYQKYLKEEQQREAARQKAEAENRKRSPEVNEMLREGFEYIRQIREANEAIPGVEVSEKLDRLEDVVGKIFLHVERHPGKLPEIRKLMQYYLPTTLKLVNAYREFEEQSLQGENIDQTKREICDTLDTINVAFANLLDGLFEDDAMDVSADISVLETMFAQEGLTGHDFRRSGFSEQEKTGDQSEDNQPLQ
ncbi:MAG TPA: 5-bromo-4-chloroindolyl phosphate hydrolysis family protein [Firmicutes bacterium]|nr:5-bromo-4-chloroindolyl phosphate hydrolysis family protein [Bacillota bacterium]